MPLLPAAPSGAPSVASAVAGAAPGGGPVDAIGDTGKGVAGVSGALAPALDLLAPDLQVPAAALAAVVKPS